MSNFPSRYLVNDRPGDMRQLAVGNVDVHLLCEGKREPDPEQHDLNKTIFI